MRNYQKVEIAYSLFHTIRNRAFHFENLFKTNTNGTPRLSTCLLFGKNENFSFGIETHKIEKCLDNILDCFDTETSGYISGTTKCSAMILVKQITERNNEIF